MGTNKYNKLKRNKKNETNQPQTKILELTISFICIYQIYEAEFPEDRKISLICLTTPLIRSRTQNLIFQEQMYCIKSTAEHLGFFDRRKQTLISWERERGGSSSNKIHLTSITHTHSFQTPKCPIFDKPKILLFQCLEEPSPFHHCHYSKEQLVEAVNWGKGFIHRVIEWLRLKGTLKTILFHTPA